MSSSDRALRLTVRISLLIALVSLSAFLLLRTYLGSAEKNFKSGSASEAVAKGPVTLDHVRWQVDGMQPYTQVLGDEGRRAGLENNVPGSVVVAVRVSITALDGIRLNDTGFICAASLLDDRGNVWKNQDVATTLGPASCSDDDHPITVGKPAKRVKLFVVPASAVPHLVGIQVASNEELRRVLITF
ncbi:hypothetical protein [Kribbella sp. NPDC051770]|uniref:hypothetical protein n=1 Tax=Kribbella sp. NPDC051770 TaxID=3155413 RepID=UPI00342DEAA4